MSGEHRPPSSTVAKATREPILDANSFEQLLAAAYVLQQHNDSLRAQDSAVDTSAVLSEFAEIQSLVRDGGLDITHAATLIAERLRKITSASGVSISLISDGYLDCVAESGVPATIPGSSVASHSLVATEKLRNGEIFESADALEDIRLSVDVCRELGVASLIAAPIHESGEVAGLLEVRWDRARAFQESDVQACRLMAGLTSRVVEHNSGDREVVASVPAEDNGHTITPPAFRGETPPKTLGAENGKGMVERCRVCGSPFGPGEAFCGNCSLPRAAVERSSALQSKWASLWYMRQAQGNLRGRPPVGEPQPYGGQDRARVRAQQGESREPRIARPSAPAEPERKTVPATTRGTPGGQPRTPIAAARVETAQNRGLVATPPAEVRPPRTPIVDSQLESRPTLPAARANFLPQNNAADLAAVGKKQPNTCTASQWVTHDGNSVRVAKPVHNRTVSTVPGSRAPVSSATRSRKPISRTRVSGARRSRLQTQDVIAACVAIVLALVILFVLGSSGPKANLSWYEALLVKLGVTRAPEPTQVFDGNPSAPVWLDEHTRLYYCLGSDLYGKTPGGRFTNQLDAQKNQFEPASHRFCR